MYLGIEWKVIKPHRTNEVDVCCLWVEMNKFFSFFELETIRTDLRIKRVRPIKSKKSDKIFLCKRSHCVNWNNPKNKFRIV